MDFKQVYDYTNTAVKEVLGETAVVNEDLSNIVDIGTAVFNANALDKYVKALVDHIGKVVFVDRVYRSKAPSVLMDGWTYGQVLEKIDGDLPEAVENETWNLTDGTSYDQNKFIQPSARAKFYDKRTTFEVDLSIADIQARGAFSSPAQMGRFINMIYTKAENAITLRLDKLILATIANEMAMTYHADIGASTASETSGVKAINLLKLYNDVTGEGATVSNCLQNLGFLKYASYQILKTSDHLTNYSTLFNVGGKEKFTPRDLQHIILLSDFKRLSDVYLQSDTFHNEFTRLPESADVSYWQGSGTDFGVDSCASIDVTTPDGNEVKIAHAIGTIFDRDALGVCCIDRRVTSHYNAKGEFTNYFYKFDAGYFNDLGENCVVFFIA